MSSARARASVAAPGKSLHPKMPDALAISAPQSALSRGAASAQVTISRSMGVAPVPDGVPRVAYSTMRAGEAPAEGDPVDVTSRQISVLSRRSSAETLAQEQGVEHALPCVGPEVPREHRVGHLHAGRGGREPRAEDQAVAAVGQVVRKGGRPARSAASTRRPPGSSGRRRGPGRAGRPPRPRAPAPGRAGPRPARSPWGPPSRPRRQRRGGSTWRCPSTSRRRRCGTGPRRARRCPRSGPGSRRPRRR